MLIHSWLTLRTMVMNSLWKKVTFATALGASALAFAAPAEAQRYGGYHGRDNGGAALVAGVAGLAIGAAIASSSDPYYYDYGYDGPVVAYPPVYDGYYGGYYGYDYYPSYRGYYPGYRGGYHGYDGYRGGPRGGYDRGPGYGGRPDRGGDHGRGGDGPRGGDRR